jgi:iron complex outermembrane receptor protein
VKTLKLTAIATASAVLCSFAAAQTVSPPERVEVTGSLIKRTDRETPSVVEVITREDIRNSGFASVEEFLKSKSFVDTSSIGDGFGSGFVSGISTLSMRGFGSQGTLVLINGRRIAPVAAVDINFGRGSLISVNTIPQGAIERIEVLKDGASALYGSDAMAGVVNYVLRRDYQGGEVSASTSMNDRGVGKSRRASATFGFGSLEKQRFNVYGGLEVSRRDPVMRSELLDRGKTKDFLDYRASQGLVDPSLPNTPYSFYGNYYSVPATFPATQRPPSGEVIAGNSTSGPLFLGSLAGCPEADTVGKGVPQRLPGYIASTPSLPLGMCYIGTEKYVEMLAPQERVNGSVRATFSVNPTTTAYVDVMVSSTKTTENLAPMIANTSFNLVTSRAPTISTWPMVNGTFKSQDAIILPVGHPDNPTNGKANSQPVQLLYRFEDLPHQSLQDLKSTRVVAGLEGTFGAWDYDAALMFSSTDNKAVRTNRLRSSLLNAAIASGSYRFGKPNDAAAIASVSSNATTVGDSSLVSGDFRASRELFALPGGRAAIALGAEYRQEKLSSTPDAAYLAGDYIGLVANGTAGSRDSQAAYAEMRLPVAKTLEGQAALRTERYSDFGNATTGKLGFKWDAVRSALAFRGTAATGFRAPSISQISNSFLLSFHNSQEKRIFDPIRCNSSNPAAPVSLDPLNPARDCNVLGFAALPPGTIGSGSLPTVVSANPNLQPEKSKSFTLGMLASPAQGLDIAIDAWLFQRNNEIRVQRGQDIMDAYIADRAANDQYIIRDPNPATWLPGVANSGPILALVRQYGNFKFTRTFGIDYDVSYKFPTMGDGHNFSVTWQGTRNLSYKQQILATSPVVEYNNTALVVETPANRGNVRLNWKRKDWGAWGRYNYTSAMPYSSTAPCEAATSGSFLPIKNLGLCKLGAESTIDLGMSYSGVKNLTLAGSVLNATNDFSRSVQIPTIYNFWDTGLPQQLGRRVSLSATYSF